MRVCNRCHIEKPELEFRQRKDGYIYKICKVCCRMACKIYNDAHKTERAAWNKFHKAEKAAWNKVYYKFHKAEKAAYDKTYRDVHKTERAVCQAVYNETHKTEIAVHHKTYYKTPNGRAVGRQGRIRRRARENDALVEDFTDQEIYERDQWICGSPDCPVPGKKVNQKSKHPHPLSASIDHIIPYALGGKHERKNCQLMHLKCNLKKHKRSIGCQLRVFG